MKLGVYIQSNRRQHVGALVSAYSIRRATSEPNRFTVTEMNLENSPHAAYLRAAEGRKFTREGKVFTWRNDVLQSFPPLRFAPPELQGFEGRALAIDPDVFAFGDVLELLESDMRGKAILCRSREGEGSHLTTSVMLLDCAKLKHWRFREMFERVLAQEIEWTDWMRLVGEPTDSIGYFAPQWNDFDNLTPETRLLHNTKQRTQPWRTGLPIDTKARNENFASQIAFLKKRLFGERQYHKPHPDPAQELAFYALLREAMQNGAIDRATVAAAAKAGDIRPDSLALADRAPALPAKSSEIVAFLREHLQARRSNAAE